ncbi:hypothetical protein [Dyadobacter sp. MSC1_007]|jgi:hypothetical protein|uniref:hypothetical protein n=1 Tax=Dyadobacter sp. MSC1_007 TaxID=2909264 RepID=UPI0020306CD4|nr:hypothetical protein [Dyadobacter sp. MSC1_007]
MTTFYKLYTLFLWTTLVIVIAVFGLVVFRYAFNFPFYDDFENIVLFIHKFTTTNSLANRVALLFEQNFEHRVLFSRVVTLTQFLLTGQVNIKWLIIIGDLSLIGVLWLFYTYQKTARLSLPVLLAIGCLLFQLQTYEDTISWATCSLQHAPCIFFSLWSFHLALHRRSLYASGALALLALFTSANGLAAIAIWLFIVSITTVERRKVLLPAAILIALTILHITTLTIHSGSVFSHVTSNIGPKFVLLLSFAGQLADPNLTPSFFSIILGALFVLPLPLAIFQSLFVRSRSVSILQWLCIAGLSCLLFVAFLIVFARGSEPDPGGYKMDRYKIYAAFFGVFAVAFYDGYLPSSFKATVARNVAACTCLLFCLTSYYSYYVQLVNYQSSIEANQFNFLWSRRIQYPLIYQDQDTKVYLAPAQASFLSKTLPEAGHPLLTAHWESTKDSLIVEKTEGGDVISLSQNSFHEKGGYDKLFVAAINKSDKMPAYLFKVEGNYPSGVKHFLNTFSRPVDPGFRSLVFKHKMRQGEYEILLVSLKKGRAARLYYLTRVDV